MWGHQGCFTLAVGLGHDAALAAVPHLGHVRHHGCLEHAGEDVRELRVRVELLQRGQEGRLRRQRQLGEARVAPQVQDLRERAPLSARPARPLCPVRGPAARGLGGRAQAAPGYERWGPPAGWAAAGR